MNQRPSAIDLQGRDAKLLRLLISNARLSASELGRRTGMSAPAVRERIQRMQERGVIRGFFVDIDPSALGCPVELVVRIRPHPGQLRKVADLARVTRHVTECQRITGEDCFIMRIQIRSLDDLDTVLDPFVAYGQTTTSVVQSSPVPRRSLFGAADDGSTGAAGDVTGCGSQ
jgi:Lrp/AsnC family leucine-responsive transcriptional regulator